MEFSMNAMATLRFAVSYAKEKQYEYVTPELLLLSLLQDREFLNAFRDCGGDKQPLVLALIQYLEKYVDKVTDVEPEFSDAMEHLLSVAGQSAFNSGAQEVALRHLVRGLFRLENSYAVYYLEEQGVSELELLQNLTEEEAYFEETSEDLSDTTPLSFDDVEEADSLTAFAPCLNDTLKEVNPLIGRQEELERTIQILCRKDKNNPLHIGEPGVGKTALTYGLVKLLKDNKVPEVLQGAKVFALDLGSLLAGTQYRGDFEKRLKKVLADISKEEKPIIYIDEIHNLTGAGAVGEGSFDASNLLKPYLADGTIRFIGATTFEEYKKYCFNHKFCGISNF